MEDTRGEPSPADTRERHASLRHRLPHSLDAATDAMGHDRLEQGCFRKCAETTRANTWGHESFQVQKASVDTKSLRPCRVTRDGSKGRRASMCQALLVKLRWSLVLRPCGCGERLGRGKQEAMLLSQPRYAGSWPSRDVRDLGLAPVSALDGSAECFTICTSRRGPPFKLCHNGSPDLYTLPFFPQCLIVHCNHRLSQSFATTLSFQQQQAFVASILFPAHY